MARGSPSQARYARDPTHRSPPRLGFFRPFRRPPGIFKPEPTRLTRFIPTRARTGSTPWIPKIFWVFFHVLFIVLLFQFDNDMTDGGAGYQTGFAFACLLNLYAFLCVANSNPGYVSEQERCPEDQEDVYREQDRIRRERIAARVKAKRERERHAAEAEDVADDDEGGDDAELPDLESGGGDRTTDRTTSPRGEDEGTGGLLGAPGGASNSSDLATSSSFVGADNDEPPVGQYCKHCKAWQGLRTKHCHDCGRCVRKFDHHCFWVGTCVGEKNHARFVWYLVAQTALIVWAFHVSNSGWKYADTFHELFEINAGPVCMSIALFIFILFVGSLLGFHVYLIVTNQTTWEVSSRDKISYLAGVPHNVYAFSRGPMRDAREFCCSPPPPRYTLRSFEWMREWSRTETIWENKYYVCC